MSKNNFDKIQYILIVVLVSALLGVLISGTLHSKSITAANLEQIKESENANSSKNLDDANKESKKESKDKQQAIVTGTVSINGLNVRNTPSSNGSVIQSLKKDEKVTALSRNKEWIKIEHNNITGYVHSDYLTLDGELKEES